VIRSAIVLDDRYVDQKVTISGQYSGRNLLATCRGSRKPVDFVLRSPTRRSGLITCGRGKGLRPCLDARIDTTAAHAARHVNRARTAMARPEAGLALASRRRDLRRRRVPAGRSRVVLARRGRRNDVTDDDERYGGVFTAHRPATLRHVNGVVRCSAVEELVSPTRPRQFHHAVAPRPRARDPIRRHRRTVRTLKLELLEGDPARRSDVETLEADFVVGLEISILDFRF